MKADASHKKGGKIKKQGFPIVVCSGIIVYFKTLFFLLINGGCVAMPVMIEICGFLAPTWIGFCPVLYCIWLFDWLVGWLTGWFFVNDFRQATRCDFSFFIRNKCGEIEKNMAKKRVEEFFCNVFF